MALSPGRYYRILLLTFKEFLSRFNNSFLHMLGIDLGGRSDLGDEFVPLGIEFGGVAHDQLRQALVLNLAELGNFRWVGKFLAGSHRHAHTPW